MPPCMMQKIIQLLSHLWGELKHHESEVAKTKKPIVQLENEVVETRAHVVQFEGEEALLRWLEERRAEFKTWKQQPSARQAFIVIMKSHGPLERLFKEFNGSCRTWYT